MVEMFKNYPQPEGYKPDNYPKCHKKNDLVIMTGESASHTFEVPFNVETETLDFDVLYQLGIELIITKNKAQCTTTTDEEANKSFITCNLVPAETLAFKNTTLKARVQIRFWLKDYTYAYTEIYDIKLMNSLDASEEIKPTPVPPTIIKGIGYTED